MNNNFTCIIIDDEPDAIELLAGQLGLLFNNLEITHRYTRWEEALNALRKTAPDIVFMDISMPGKNGMELLRLIPELESEIIFVTAHEEYALKAFEFATSGYLLKPVDDVELLRSVQKAMQRVQKKRLAAQTQPVKIGIPDNKGITYVNIADIQYLEAVNGYTKVVMHNNVLLSSFNLRKFKMVIDDISFYQVHRSFVVNLAAVSRYKSTGEIVMKDEKEIPVAKSIRQEFLNLFNMVSKTTE